MNLDNFVLLFCNGDVPSRERIQNLLPHPKLIACADGGANRATSLGYKPDVVIGDLDSLAKTKEHFQKAEIIKIDSQDNTDFEKTLNVLIDRGFRNFLVVAFSGGRIDQTLANLQIAYDYSRSEADDAPSQKQCKIVLADNDYLIFPVVDNFNLEVTNGSDASIIPMEDGTVVTTDGLAYELHQTFLRRGGQGISNRAAENKIAITVHKGGVLVFIKDVNESDPYGT